MSLLESLGLVKETKKPEVAQVAALPVATPVRPVSKRRGGVDDSQASSTEDESSAPTNKEVETQLRKAIQNSGGEGFDYVKLINMLKKNKSMDESVSFAAAISAAETMGVSVEELVDSAKLAIKAVNNESKKIDADLAEQVDLNNKNQEELKRINTQLASLTSRKESLEEKISSSSSSIEEAEKSLESTVDLVVGEINDVVSKIKKYSK